MKDGKDFRGALVEDPTRRIIRLRSPETSSSYTLLVAGFTNEKSKDSSCSEIVLDIRMVGPSEKVGWLLIYVDLEV